VVFVKRFNDLSLSEFLTDEYPGIFLAKPEWKGLLGGKSEQ
jgi:hypothetical protein